MSVVPRPDQRFRDQPFLFGGESDHIDHGKRSRDETFREIAEELPERCKIWLGRVIAAGSRGVTLDELSEQSGLPANEFSGRITELKNRGLVRHTSERRPTRKGSTAAVIVAVGQDDSEPKQLELQTMSKTVQVTEMPDAITNCRTPRDQHGQLIEHGELYEVAGIGLVQVHYDVEQDEYFFFRPSAPDKQQPVSMLPPQMEAWWRC